MARKAMCQEIKSFIYFKNRSVLHRILQKLHKIELYSPLNGVETFPRCRRSNNANKMKIKLLARIRSLESCPRYRDQVGAREVALLGEAYSP